MTVLNNCDYVVRLATGNDLARLATLEEAGPDQGRVSKQQLRARLKRYPQGQFVIERDGVVHGALYTQRIPSEDALDSHIANLHRLHDDAGAVVQLLAMRVDRALQATAVPGILLSSVLERCREGGADRIVGILPCEEPGDAGDDADAVPPLHAAHGATAQRAIAGHGLLVSYERQAGPAQGGRDEPGAGAAGHLFVLSAASRERLQAYAAKVEKWLGSCAAADFEAAIHTWQVGRTAMKSRLAIRVAGLDDLRAKLAAWCNSGTVPHGWCGSAASQGGAQGGANDGAAAVREQVERALAARDWDLLGQLWTAGADVDWAAAHAPGQRRPRRTSVPTYPFARERHWIEGEEVGLPAAPEPDASMAHVFVQPVWEPAPLSKQAKPDAHPSVARHHVVLCQMGEVNAEQLAALVATRDCCHLLPTQPVDLGQRYVDYAAACFEKVKAILAGNPQETVLLQVVLPNQPGPNLLAGLSGLLKTATEENPRFLGQIVLTNLRSPAALAEQLRSEKERLDSAVILYTRGLRHVLRWRPAHAEHTATVRQGASFRERGVYLITGGLGGLGCVFVNEILRRAPNARIILTGRSLPEGARRQALEQLSRQAVRHGGHPIEYRQLDLENREQVEQLVAELLQEHKQLNGILHSAGMAADNLILNKTVQEFRQVLAPKVNGTLNLDEASRDVALDFFVLFSSATSVFGNAGQADYAAANGFMDQFAAYRNRLVDGKERTGHTVSINWPLWQDGGMAMDAAVIETLRRSVGLRPMQTATGLRIFYESLAAQCDQTMVLEGDSEKLGAMVAAAALPSRTPAPRRSGAVADAGRLQDEMQKRIRQLFADITKRPAARIDMNEELAAYGIDSIIISNLNLELARAFGDIPKTLFFEFKTLAEVSAYFLKEYPQECAAWTGQDGEPAPADASVPAAAALQERRPAPAEPGPWRPARTGERQEPIAIIGLSGIYPQSPDLDTFWANLQSGRNCIGEIPADRWPLDGFYEPDVDQAVEQGKSYSKWGGFIEQFADFDPLFFNISPREAMNMDPQERLFLQECWRALEDAGYTREDLKLKYGQRVGVFTGITKPGYNLYAMQATRSGEPFLPYTSFSSAANRISYFLDVTGPSMPVDTMCSSSLIAIHEACEHIRRGECELAFAGGVNLYLHPYTYNWLCSHRMLSRDGVCRSFGVGSNGFVPGEGVGVVMLKPLSAAVRDKDNIHGVILASQVNHGGRTNGYTVPSPKAQAELIRATIDKAGIQATDIGYIEAHGTGTELGDPIEIAGLQQAFSRDSRDTGYCRIGSAKSNIGHLEAAAGIAGLTKVLLQMKHGQIAPSLHAEQLNPNIAFGKTAFRVNTGLAPWEQAGGAAARIAGISSFGAAGANAHLIVQEYVAPELPGRHAEQHAQPLAILLSARTPAALEQRARDLLRFVRANPAADLAAIAYTLQVGREAMEQRLACLAGSTAQLADRLQAFLDGHADIDGCYRGAAGAGSEGLHLFGDDEDFRETLDKWIARRKMARLAELWAGGMHLDWNKLYGVDRPVRLALPAYPFARDRMWVDTVVLPVQPATSAAGAAGAPVLHPLLHANTSDLARQRYTSVFSGDEFFLRDHVVDGVKILPAVAYLEMARAATALAAAPKQPAVLELRNTTWAHPIAVSGAREVDIVLFADDVEGVVEFEISAAEADGEAVAGGQACNCQGQALFVPASPPVRIDIAALKAAMTAGQEDVARLYQDYHGMGVAFGPAHRAIQVVHRGERQLLAQLSLPQVVGATRDAYLLHPSLMDSALQASIGLMDASVRASRRPFLPFALDTLRVLAPCTEEMFAWVRLSANAIDGMVSFDVDLCDEQGQVCVQLHGFSSRQADTAAVCAAQAAADTAPAPAHGQLQALAPVWNRVSPVRDARPATGRVLLVGGGREALDWARAGCPDAQWLDLPAHAGVDAIVERLAGQEFDHLLWLAPDVAGAGAGIEPDRIVAAQDEGVLAVLRIAKALLELGHAHESLRWTFITRRTQRVKETDQVAPAHAGLAGMVGSMAKEYPEWELRLLDVDTLDGLAAGECLALAADKQGQGLVRRAGEWFRQGLAHVAVLPEAPPAYRQGGVYVVIGGAGGIGEAWSRYMIERYDAKLVWIGRRPLDAAIGEKIAALGRLGRAPVYLAADAGSRAALEQAHRRILEIHPRIHGVVHSAIDLQDQSLALMDEAAFRSSLAAKVDVSVNLDQVFGGNDLDCMLFFSSLIAFTRGAGQANYAAGCTFKDSFAHSLAGRRPYPVKIMNWGYWGTVGVVADAFYTRRMEQMGVGSIEVPEAMQALQRLVDSGLQQMAVVKTLDPRVLDELAVPERFSCFPATTVNILPQARRDVGALSGMKPAAALEQDLLGAQTRTLAGDILASSLASLGLHGAQGGQAPAPAVHARWLRASLDYVRENDCRVLALDLLWQEWEAKKGAWLVNANLRAQVGLIETCLRALPDVLSGKRRATDVMFPDSSMRLVEGVYKDHALADYANDVLGATLAACIRRRLEADGKAGIRIVEIGAGTGGTTARLAPVLREFGSAIAEYRYTDLSRAFLIHAEEQYGPVLPALATAIFDVSQPLEPQGLAPDRYDFAIATNVLHATPDIRETLRNAKALLKNGGVLLVNEMCGWSLFSHVSFGLLEGWWLYEDTPLRLAGSPGLAPDTWRDVLEEEGYEAVSFLAEDAHAFGQQVIAASSNGQVRQRIAQAAAAPSALPAALAADIPAAMPGVAGGSAALREKCIAYLQEVVARTLRMDPAQVGAGRPLVDYGLDSILVVGLTNQLRKSFPGLTSTLFFEVPHIAGLADYLVGNKREHVLALFGADAAPPVLAQPALAPAVVRGREALPPRLSRKGHAAGGQPGANGPALVDVAIIGLSGRYPQAPDLASFWRNLSSGRNCVTEIPAERWDWKDYYHPEKGRAGSTYTKWGGFLQDIDCFDPLFFKISPKEAKLMDPQERLFLESCYHAIEDAGYTPDTLGDLDKIGVFAGVMNSRYNPQPLYYSIANRVSFVMNFQGPSMAVDSACSSSLTAIHLALESIYSGLSACALAGGVNLIIDPVHYLELSALTMLSGGKECKSFGDGADGFIDAEGVGVVLLKPLDKAERDGDHIYGVIKASAVNAGGKTNGYTVPNPVAQAAVVAKALERARVSAADISYVEAHGTGTALGDPIEIAGLKRAFEQSTQERQFCAIGSLKSNIGHCESAAGIAALTKVLLQLKHGQLVPSLHADVANHEIDFARTPFRIQKDLQDWRRPRRAFDGVVREVPRMAGISSFGAGGANAHVIVQEYVQAVPTAPAASAAQPAAVLAPLSARTAEQLRQKAADLLRHVRAGQGTRHADDLAALAYTLQVGREALEERAAFVAGSMRELEDKLGAWLDGREAAGIWLGRVKRHAEGCDPALQLAAAQSADAQDLPALASAWAGGARVEWSRLHGTRRPRRVSLPAYPFSRERYWRERSGGVPAALPQQWLHPLLQRNVSDMRQQCYRSAFGGNEPFAMALPAASGGEGRMVLPAAALLEMARAAVEDATSSVPEAVRVHRTIELFNVVWAEPAPVGTGTHTAIALFDQGEGQLAWEVYGGGAGTPEEIIHCQGQALLCGESAPVRHDLARLRSQMGRHAAPAGDGQPDRVVHAVHVGERQALAELRLPGSGGEAPMRAGWGMHPLMLDGALQATLGLLAPGSQPSFPMALQSLRILGECGAEMLAWVRPSAGQETVHGSLELDIDLFDPQGKVCVELRGLAYEGAPAPGPAAPRTAPAAAPQGEPPGLAPGGAGVVLGEAQAPVFGAGATAKPSTIVLALDA